VPANPHSELSISRLIHLVRNGMAPKTALAHLKMIATARKVTLDELHDTLATTEARCRLQGIRPTKALLEICAGYQELPWPK
jgi:hypothetical protein